MTTIAEAFSKAKNENRAALIGYLPAGYPTKTGAIECISAIVAGGVDIIEIGLPYSDPLMDGVTIQEAVQVALENGTKIADVIDTAGEVSKLGVATLVMSYWNPIERYGVAKFAQQLHQAGGVGVITPDLTPEESAAWTEATDANEIDRVFLVALSSTDTRLATVASATTGFVYAGAVMGVTGARSALGDSVREVVNRTRQYTDLPIAVGLGVSTPEQAHEIAQYADGVIVGSAFINAIARGGAPAAHELAVALRAGVER
ncbi:MAG: tryptophan synthase subunit alpha [Actinomycetales bacterium]|nr:tryptophan synthase subunit alpha [Actinomycetales bacterium]